VLDIPVTPAQGVLQRSQSLTVDDQQHRLSGGVSLPSCFVLGHGISTGR